MSKQTCNIYKRVTFTIIDEQHYNIYQLLNLLDNEALYHQISIGLVTSDFFGRWYIRRW